MNDNFEPYAPYEPYEQKNNKKVKKEKKHGRFFKVVASIVCAVLLGTVAGGVCYGVSYAGYSLFPVNVKLENQTTANEAPTTVAAGTNQQISTGSADKNINATVYDVSDIVSSVISSVVAVEGTITQSVQYGFFGQQTYDSDVSGSGIIIGKNDTELLVVTNAHVVEDVNDIQLTLYDGSTVPATVKGMKSSYDLAVLAVKLSDIPDSAIYTMATLANTTELKVGEAAIAVGNSMGSGISVTTGCISALNRTVTVDNVEYKNLIQTDAAINPGNSGGALFNASGEVIGINSVKMKETGVEGMGYAISVASVNDIINELSIAETKEKLSDDERGYLGINGVSVTSEISKVYGYPVGVLVRSVVENSAADVAGINKNDIIYSFDGEEIDSIDTLVEMMSYYPVGEEVEVKYYHMSDKGEYEEKSVTVKLLAKDAK